MPKKKNGIKRSLTIYTVSSSVFDTNFGLGQNVAGSYLRRGQAIRECARLVFFWIDNHPGFRSSFIESREFAEYLNTSRPEIPVKDLKYFESGSCGIEMSKRLRKVVNDYLIDVIGGDSCFVLGGRWRFDVDENDVECKGGLETWTCITSGRSDPPDPEFDQPFPEPFLCEGDAVRCAMSDIWRCLDGYDDEDANNIMKEAHDCIEKGGYYELALNDEKTRRWDVWHTPIDIGSGRKQICR